MSEIKEACRDVLPRIRAAAADTEKLRRLDPVFVSELARAGAFRMLVPKRYGGGEVTPVEMIEVIESVARADASAGWLVMVCSTSGFLSAYLDESVAREIHEKNRDVVTCGVFAPTGTATIESDGALRVKGRWSFASGVEHASYRMGGVLMIGADGKPALKSDGAPDVRHVIFDAKDTTIVDTWDVAGLSGSGSHDFVVESVRVDPKRAVMFVHAKPQVEGALYTFPPIGLLALGVAAVTLGIAQEAIAELVRLASEKRPGGARRTLADRELTQAHVGEAMGLVGSARAFMIETAREITAKATKHGAIEDADRARLRLAATHATRACARAVDLMYEDGGGTSIYKKNALQRYFRDVHVATQHAMVQASTYTLAGRVAMGVPVDKGAL